MNTNYIKITHDMNCILEQNDTIVIICHRSKIAYQRHGALPHTTALEYIFQCKQ